MPDFGIGEGLAAFGGGDLLASIGSLFGIGGAEAAGGAAAETGAGLIGSAGSLAAANALPTAGIADIVGSGEGLFGGTLGTEGTLLAGGSGLTVADLAGGTAGLGALGTATDFLAAPGASGFNAAALTPGVGAAGGGPGVLGAAAPPPTPTPVGSTSVFDTGTSGIPGVSSSGAPAAPSAITPPGASAASVAAPSGVSGVPDATAVAAGATPGATPGAPAAASAPTSSIDQLLSKMSPSNLANSSIESLTKNPLGVALGAGGLGYSIYEGSQQTANQKALQATATSANNNSTALEQQGQGLVNYLTSGQLPAGYQTQITQSIQSAIANAKSNAAAQGLSTDPTQNTALATTIQQIQDQEPILQEQIAAQLAGTGTSLISAGATASGLSGQLYQALVQNDTTQAANAGKAIATLAAALNGKSQNSVGGSTGSTG